MIYTLTFNPSLDYMVSVDNLEINRVNRSKEEFIYPGGKGINVSMVLKNLGYESIALGFIAGFTGEAFEKLVNEKGITSEFIRVENGMSRINVKLKSGMITSENGRINENIDETEINGQGPVIVKEDMDKLFGRLESLKDGDILVLAGSIPTSISESVYSDIIGRLTDKNIKIIVDASKELLKSVLKYRPFLIKPNNFELGELFGVEILTKDDVIKYANVLKEQGARNVLVSMAEDGAILLTENGETLFMDAPVGEVINSVGAGDSMVAGFIAGYVSTESFMEALKMGICTGSASAFSKELATIEEVNKLLYSVGGQ